MTTVDVEVYCEPSQGLAKLIRKHLGSGQRGYGLEVAKFDPRVSGATLIGRCSPDLADLRGVLSGIQRFAQDLHARAGTVPVNLAIDQRWYAATDSPEATAATVRHRRTLPSQVRRDPPGDRRGRILQIAERIAKASRIEQGVVETTIIT